MPCTSQAYLVHNLKGIVVVWDSCLVEIVVIGYRRVAFLVAALYSVHLLAAVVVDICVVTEVLDNFLEYFCKLTR